MEVQHILSIISVFLLLFSCNESEEKRVNKLDNFVKIDFLTLSKTYKVDYYYFNYDDINQELKISRKERSYAKTSLIL